MSDVIIANHNLLFPFAGFLRSVYCPTHQIVVLILFHYL